MMREDIYVFSQYAEKEPSFQIWMVGVSYCDSSYRIERADYHHYVIEHVIEGTGILEAEGEVFELGPGDTYFLYKGRGHKYYCKDDRWIKIWLVMDGPLADALFGAYLENRPNVLLGFDVLNKMESIMDLAKDKSISYEQLIRKAAVTVHSILAAAKVFSEEGESNLQEAVKDYIDDHLDRPLLLEELAKQFHYSKNHIINMFRERYGMTPYVYYEMQRIYMAREMLVNTTISISDLSVQLGYNNPQYFSKCFKKYCGMSPLKFRGK